jgi:hypothetical protein
VLFGDKLEHLRHWFSFIMTKEGAKLWLAEKCHIELVSNRNYGKKRELIITSKSAISMKKVNVQFKDCLGDVIVGTEPDQSTPASQSPTPAATSKRKCEDNPPGSGSTTPSVRKSPRYRAVRQLIDPHAEVIKDAITKTWEAVTQLESVETGGGDELRDELRRSIIHHLERLFACLFNG